MRTLSRTLVVAAVAFGGGLLASPVLQHAMAAAHAQGVLAPAMYDLLSMQAADLFPTSYPSLRNRTLVVTDNATIALQIGTVSKHYHAKSDEIQYIVEGSGQMWVGNVLREIHPGMLIVIPKGTAHAGTIVTSGPIKSIAIKIPPQENGDSVPVD